MNDNNVTDVLLQKLTSTSKDFDDELISAVIDLLIILLTNGNTDVQQSVYKFFVSKSSSENFFKKLHDIIHEEIDRVEDEEKSKNIKELKESAK